MIVLTDSRSRIVYRPLPQDDPVQRVPTSPRARMLDWQPRVPLEDGLMRTIAYFDRSLHWDHPAER